MPFNTHFFSNFTRQIQKSVFSTKIISKHNSNYRHSIIFFSFFSSSGTPVTMIFYFFSFYYFTALSFVSSLFFHYKYNILGIFISLYSSSFLLFAYYPLFYNFFMIFWALLFAFCMPLTQKLIIFFSHLFQQVNFMIGIRAYQRKSHQIPFYVPLVEGNFIGTERRTLVVTHSVRFDFS